jgi:hypothetical protein
VINFLKKRKKTGRRCQAMVSARGKNCIALRLEDGDDFFPALREAMGEVSTAAIVSAIGMLRDFELGWHGPEGYVKKLFREPFELLSITGTINIQADGSPFVHAHASLSGPDYSAVGGHLFHGTVNNTCEIFLLVPEGLTFHRRVIREGEAPRFCPEKA